MLLNDAETNQIIRALKRLKLIAILAVIFIVYCLLFNPMLLLAIIAIVGLIFGALYWARQAKRSTS